MNALDVTINRINELQGGIDHYNTMLPHYKNPDNVQKWKTYVRLLEKNLDEEKGVAIGLIDVKISQLTARLSGMAQMNAQRELVTLREQLTGELIAQEPLVVVC